MSAYVAENRPRFPNTTKENYEINSSETNTMGPIPSLQEDSKQDLPDNPLANIIFQILKSFGIMSLSSQQLSEVLDILNDVSNSSIQSLFEKADKLGVELNQELIRQEDLKRYAEEESSRQNQGGLFALISGLVELVIGVASLVVQRDPAGFYLVLDGACRVLGGACQLAGIDNDYTNSLANHGTVGLLNCISGDNISEETMQKMELGLALVMSASFSGMALKGAMAGITNATKVVIAAHYVIMTAGNIISAADVKTGSEGLDTFLISLSGGLPGIVTGSSMAIIHEILKAAEVDPQKGVYAELGLNLLFTIVMAIAATKMIQKHGLNLENANAQPQSPSTLAEKAIKTAIVVSQVLQTFSNSVSVRIGIKELEISGIQEEIDNLNVKIDNLNKKVALINQTLKKQSTTTAQNTEEFQTQSIENLSDSYDHLITSLERIIEKWGRLSVGK